MSWWLIVRNASIGSSYEIYDNAGKRLRKGRVINAVQEIQLSGISSGLYSISIKDEYGDCRNLRFVKE